MPSHGEARFVLGLGSNLGDSPVILQGAVADLCTPADLQVTGISRVFETDPVGGPEQPVYLNAVVIGRTSREPHELLALTQGIEQSWHRIRDVRWGPRTLDIDILAVDAETVDSDDLEIPHPRAHERAFVLVPWADVAPDAVIPGHGSVADLLEAVGTDGVRAADVALRLPERE